jgi:hypothetical protein
MSDVSIYALCEPDTGLVRYIGISVSPQARYNGHLNTTCTSGRKVEWVKKLALLGKRPVMEILATVPEQDARQQERLLILCYRAKGYDLLNRQPYTEEDKRAMREAVRLSQEAYLAGRCDECREGRHSWHPHDNCTCLGCKYPELNRPAQQEEMVPAHAS